MAFTIRNNEAASQFLSEIFDWFDKNQILYSIQRNYQGYPETITGDVDFVVPDGQLFASIDGIMNAALQTGWHCYLQNAWEKTAYLGFYQAVYPDRFTLTIELFAGARWHGIPYLSSEEILSRRMSCGVTWRPHPVDQAIITVIHHLLYNYQVPPKYRQEVLLLIKDDAVLFQNILAKSIGQKFANEIANDVVEQKWDALANRVRTYQVALLTNALKRPISLISTLLDGFAAKKKAPKGALLVVEGKGGRFQDALCDELLKLADKWHIFIPPIREIFLYSDKDMLEGQDEKVSRILRGGGVVIINGRKKFERRFKEFPLHLIRCNEENCFLEMDHSRYPELKNKCQLDSRDVVQLAYQVWDYILDSTVQINGMGSDDSE
ncbi:MAG: hypothetical protein DWQ04_06830 [Chloroflexi bacterium]|nr:MAG: hypothetical protein DWQ04_06830 [Chloroflexota bacterium]